MACGGGAGVGICGLVLGDERYVRLALHGLAGDRKTGGYLAEIDLLSAPSGYYTEGPHDHRFAMRALLSFSEVLHAHRPDLVIYSHKNQAIRTTIRALLCTLYPDGKFPALNDSSLSMGLHDAGVLMAAAVYDARYGDEPAVHALARQQGEVWVHPSALGERRLQMRCRTRPCRFGRVWSSTKAHRVTKALKAFCVLAQPTVTSPRCA
jgi:oligo-alginate lyase